MNSDIRFKFSEFFGTICYVGHIPFKYNLKLLCQQFFGIELDKEGQTQWTPYLNTPLEEIPQELIEYGALDVITTYYLLLLLVLLIAITTYYLLLLLLLLTASTTYYLLL